MKSALCTIMLLCLVMFATGQSYTQKLLGPALLGQAPPTPIPVSTSTSVAWDYTGLDTNGDLEQVQGFEMVLTAANVDLSTLPPAQQVFLATQTIQGANVRQASLSTILQGIAPGTYRLWIRTIDQASNNSTWSNDLAVSPDSVLPAAPTNFRINITITIGG